MSWLRVDDGWADSAKVDSISDVAARLWCMAATWCSKKENQRLDGFVSRAVLPTITKRRWPEEVLDAAIHDLVETAKLGGLHEHGLWETREGGWRFHDWEKYKPKDSDEPALTPREAASVAGKASAAARAAKNGTAQPQKPRTSTVRPPNEQTPFEDRSSDSFDGTPTERLEPPVPDPVPDPDQPQNSNQSPDRLKPIEPAAPQERPRHIRRFEDSFTKPMPAAMALFEVFRAETGKFGLEYDHRARELFERLVHEAVSASDVRLVVAGAKRDDWATAQTKLSASALLGTSEQRQRFIALARDPPQPSLAKGKAPPQPNNPANRFQPRVIR